MWTWRSALSHGARLPVGWSCTPVTAAGGTGTRDCAVQPMLTLDYAVAGLSLTGTTPAGRQSVAVTVGHLQLSRTGPAIALHAWVSFDGGKTWRAASVTRRGAGRFGVTFTAAAGSAVTLRVRATGPAGGSVTETIGQAWRVHT